MTTDAPKNQLIEQFQAYLEQSTVEAVPTIAQPDLNTLLSEMVSLKTEVKVESRQFKNTLDTLDTTLATVQDDNKILSETLAQSTRQLKQQQDETMRAMLLEFIDVYDRLSASMGILQNYRPVKSIFKSSRKKDIHFIKRFKDGQLMTIRHLDQVLKRYHVDTIDCINKLFDPTTMIAVETGNNQNIENAVVLEELRAGFLYKNQVLRLAEVKVNKINIK